MDHDLDRALFYDGKKVKINRVSVVDQVCSSIKNNIAAGIWKAGDRLPAEAEFAEIFGVNRLSVRMALQKLNTLGIIETRVGEGSFVRDFSLKPVLNELAVFYEGEEQFRDIQQMRKLLEYECMCLAACMATEQEKELLRTVLEDYRRCLEVYNTDLDNEEALERLVDADFLFHYTIVKISHNRLYKDVYFMVHQLIRGHITKLISKRLQARKNAGLPTVPLEEDTHYKIYMGILHSDTEALHQAAEEVLAIVPVPGMDIFE